jgi:hypothetical protein
MREEREINRGTEINNRGRIKILINDLELLQFLVGDKLEKLGINFHNFFTKIEKTKTVNRRGSPIKCTFQSID